MIGVVGVAGLLDVLPTDGLGAVLDVRVRVERVDDGRPVPVEQPDEGIDQPVVRVRTRPLQR